MSSFKDCLTIDGQSLFASATKGHRITFTKIVIGDGIMNGDDMECNMKSVICPRCTLPIESVTKIKDNKICIKAIYKSTDAAGFYFREKGVYATIDGEKEYLVFYANNGAYAEWIDKGSSQMIEKIIRTIVSFSDSDRINIALNISEYGPPTIQTNYITIEDFSKNNDVDVGTKVILPNGDIYIFNGKEYVQINGAQFVQMTESTYIPVAERKKGGIYGFVTDKRGLIVETFDRYISGTEDPRVQHTLYGIETEERTTLEEDTNSYAAIFSNVVYVDEGEDTERQPDMIYIVHKKGLEG
ncbi:MAG: hypothetical protein NC434_13945 [Ruminococcus sp.]|nr:hypothetical protein [Ruminococcus sp.]